MQVATMYIYLVSPSSLVSSHTDPMTNLFSLLLHSHNRASEAPHTGSSWPSPVDPMPPLLLPSAPFQLYVLVMVISLHDIFRVSHRNPASTPYLYILLPPQQTPVYLPVLLQLPLPLLSHQYIHQQATDKAQRLFHCWTWMFIEWRPGRDLNEKEML